MIDTHAHLNLLSRTDLGLAIEASRQAGLTGIIQVSTDIDSAKEGLRLSQIYPEVFPTVGIHPLYQDMFGRKDELIPLIEANRAQIVALGEIGLDYHYDVPAQLQHPVFIYQMNLARQFNLPVIIHNRKADEDVKKVLDQYPDLSIVLHCYSSNIEYLESFNRDNLWVSFTGMICNQDKGKVIRAVERWPLERMMIETDCPYMVPKQFAGNENQPAYVVEVAKRIAMLKGVGIETVIDQTTQNAKQFFGLGDVGRV